MRWLKPGKDDAMAADLAAMRRYARSLARNGEDADDVVQDALLRAIERQQTFLPERSRRRWLLAIVHNVFISGKRREAAEMRRNDRLAEMMIDNIVPEQEQEQRTRLAQLARAFADLPDHHRAILHLIVIEGLSYQEAADVLEVPIGTIMSRLARARTSLRESEGEKPGKAAGQQIALRIVGGKDV
jgi:RNA polymerase sigma-70 factor (ECF subfamily)